MKVTIEINKQVKFRKFAEFDLYIDAIIGKALDICGRKRGEYVISLLLCDNNNIQELNYRFRKKNKPTNVLSFPDGEVFNNVILLGDIAISIETIATEAKDQGKTFKTHFLHMLIHGVLHLLGMDHENQQDQCEMESAEDVIMDFIVTSFQKK